jgi:very-short-patch-repair endonuclease
MGWRVLRLWEHQVEMDIVAAANRIIGILKQRRARIEKLPKLKGKKTSRSLP